MLDHVLLYRLENLCQSDWLLPTGNHSWFRSNANCFLLARAKDSRISVGRMKRENNSIFDTLHSIMAAERFGFFRGEAVRLIWAYRDQSGRWRDAPRFGQKWSVKRRDPKRFESSDPFQALVDGAFCWHDSNIEFWETYAIVCDPLNRLARVGDWKGKFEPSFPLNLN